MQNVTSSNWKVSKSFLSLVESSKHNTSKYESIVYGDFIEKANHLGFDIISFGQGIRKN